MEFQKVSSRDPSKISRQWRLASVDEVRRNLEQIKRQNILQTWTILRLLDGSVDGEGYGYKVAQEYRQMGEMLLVKTNESSPSDGSFNPKMYAGVELNAKGREVALLLTLDDTQVLYKFKQVEDRLVERERLILKMKQDLGCNC